MKAWQGIFVAIIVCGLIIGWASGHVLAGLVFIWIAIIVVETLFWKKGGTKSRARK